jgi:hypothetical protein
VLFKIPLSLGLGAEALDGSYDVLLLVEKCLADIRGPSQIVVEPLENGGIMDQRLDAGIPWLLGGRVHIPALG